MLLVAEAKLPSSKVVTPSTITHLFRSTVFGFTSTSPYRDALDLLSGMSHILAEIDLEEAGLPDHSTLVKSFDRFQMRV